MVFCQLYVKDIFRGELAMKPNLHLQRKAQLRGKHLDLTNIHSLLPPLFPTLFLCFCLLFASLLILPSSMLSLPLTLLKPIWHHRCKNPVTKNCPFHNRNPLSRYG